MKSKIAAAALATTVALAALAGTTTGAFAGVSKYWNVHVPVSKATGPKSAANKFCGMKGYAYAAGYDFDGFYYKKYVKVADFDYVTCASKGGVTIYFSFGGHKVH